MTDEKTTMGNLETPPLCMVDYFAGRTDEVKSAPMTARVVARHGNVIEVDFMPVPVVPKIKARRLTSRWEEAGVVLLLAACAAAGAVSLLRH